MGSVFGARRLSDGQPVVVKFLAPDLAEKPLLRQRFQREWDALRKIHPHPNVVKVLDVRSDGTLPCLAMEYVPGTPLDALLQQQARLPPLQAASITRDMARGLAAVHAHGLIHRDVKPANAIVAPNGQA
jgi:serine/threonine-protein kinase